MPDTGAGEFCRIDFPLGFLPIRLAGVWACFQVRGAIPAEFIVIEVR
jgi:hypothetical protein